MVETLAGVGLTALIGFAGWISHLGSRVSVVESKQEAFEKWLERIEEKIDALISRR
jgi:hypothetical protein